MAEVLGGGDPDQTRLEEIEPTGGQGVDDFVGALLVGQAGAGEPTVCDERLVGVTRELARDLVQQGEVRLVRLRWRVGIAEESSASAKAADGERGARRGTWPSGNASRST